MQKNHSICTLQSIMHTSSFHAVLTLLIMPLGLSVLACLVSACHTPLCMPGAHLDAQGACSGKAPVFHLPFRKGFKTEVNQGFHGYQTHKNHTAYAVDFSCSEGVPVVAAYDGTVWDIRKDSNSGCDEESCANQANFVIIDHGNGMFSEYFHLSYKGVFVQPGDKICSGQLIGLCGRTGYATGPHLHFDVVDAARMSIPIHFEELRQNRMGITAPHAVYTSQNKRKTTCAATKASTLSQSAFAHQGIVLDQQIPMRLSWGASKTFVSGIYQGDYTKIAIHRKRVLGQGKWRKICVDVDANRRFRAVIDWEDPSFAPGFYWFMMTGVTQDCKDTGWAWSYKMLLR